MDVILTIMAWPLWDWQLFRFINIGMSNEFFDVIMPFLRNKWTWLPLYVFVMSFMIYHWKRRSWLVLLFFLLSFTAADFFSARLIKPLVQRERPCNDPNRRDHLNTRVFCGAGYSFPSAHASNHSSMGVFLFLLFGGILRKSRYVFLLWAFLVSFAQVYVGVHYPIDIVVGWILGSSLALGLYFLLRFYFKYFYNQTLT